jgi:AMMECR1 domain-containing protein
LRLTLEEGRFLVRLARKSIETYLKGEEPEIPEVGERLREKRGVFVTLTEDGELRGCIGYPFPYLPLVEATVRAAYKCRPLRTPASLLSAPRS